MGQRTCRGYRDGRRKGELLIVSVQDGEGERRPLPGVLPTGPRDWGAGFEWGYAGGGPTRLATAILTDYLGRRPHPWLIDRFVTQVVARLDVVGPWTLRGQEVETWLKCRRWAKSFVLYADAD